MTTADEALRKLLAAHAPRRTTTAAAPTPIDDEGAAAGRRAGAGALRSAPREPRRRYRGALSQARARWPPRWRACPRPAQHRRNSAPTAETSPVAAALDRYAAALAAAAERERDAAQEERAPDCASPTGGGGRPPGRVRRDAHRRAGGLLAAPGAAQARRGCGPCALLFCARRFRGRPGTQGWGRHEADGSTTIVAAITFRGDREASWSSVETMVARTSSPMKKTSRRRARAAAAAHAGPAP